MTRLNPVDRQIVEVAAIAYDGFVELGDFQHFYINGDCVIFDAIGRS